MKLDSRKFSQAAYKGLIALRDGDQKTKRAPLEKKYHHKASGLVQGLPAYISTWGLHRLSGDAKKFSNGKGEDTQYKGKVYKEFLYRLKEDFKPIDFDPEDEGSLVNLPLRDYTALNHLAMQLAREWSFWATAVLGEPEE